MKTLLVILALLPGCGNGQVRSELKGQIESQFVRCDLSNVDRAESLASKYADNFTIQDSSHTELMYRYLTLIPDEYLQWLFDDVKLRVELRTEGERVTSLRGLTRVKGTTPVSMWVKPARDLGTGFYYGLNHEIGHAVDHYLFEKHGRYEGQYNKDWETAYQNTRNKLWALPAANEQELIASVFDS